MNKYCLGVNAKARISLTYVVKVENHSLLKGVKVWRISTDKFFVRTPLKRYKDYMKRYRKMCHMKKALISFNERVVAVEISACMALNTSGWFHLKVLREIKEKNKYRESHKLITFPKCVYNFDTTYHSAIHNVIYLYYFDYRLTVINICELIYTHIHSHAQTQAHKYG